MNNSKLLFFCIAFIVIINLSLFVVSAASPLLNETQENEQVNKAYNWLSNSARDKFESMSTEDAAFALLALAYDDSLALQAKDALIKKSANQECWPSTCTVRDTALVTIALSRIGVDTSKAEEWIMKQNGTPVDLVWFMQIDSIEAANCTLSYDSSQHNVTLNSKKKLSKSAGSCLSLSYGNYWLKISSACYDKKFTINCDKDFVTSLFYQKPGSPTIYISSDTKKASAGTDTELRITSICLKQDGICNYEATAWAALSVIKKQDISIFLPYLVGYADTNSRFMPNAFLYALTGQEDYANALITMQKKNGYWQAESSAYGKYYDTALAMLALQEYTSEKKTTTKSWLIDEQVKSGETEGSWGGNKKDTSFILYSIWQKEASYIPPIPEWKCEEYGYFCEQSYNCDFDIRVPDYTCSSSLDVCCKQKYEETRRTCNEMGGTLCDSLNPVCEGTTESAIDGTCCMGYCTKEEVNECENNGNACRDSCLNDEQENSDFCPGSNVCCEPSATPAKKKNWIWFLIILLLMVGVVAFLFRDKIKDKFKKKPRILGLGGITPITRPFPRFTPPPAPPLMRGPEIKGKPQMPLRIAPQTPPVQSSASAPISLKRNETDKQLDDTLKKLKEISEK